MIRKNDNVLEIMTLKIMIRKNDNVLEIMTLKIITKL